LIKEPPDVQVSLFVLMKTILLLLLAAASPLLAQDKNIGVGA